LSGGLTRSVAALLTGSSRQRLNGFIGRTPASGRIGRASICYSAPNICSSLPIVAISLPSGQEWGTGAPSPSILNGNSL